MYLHISNLSSLLKLLQFERLNKDKEIYSTYQIWMEQKEVYWHSIWELVVKAMYEPKYFNFQGGHRVLCKNP